MDACRIFPSSTKRGKGRKCLHWNVWIITIIYNQCHSLWFKDMLGELFKMGTTALIRQEECNVSFSAPRMHCWSFCMGPFLLGMHECVLPNCQAHSGQHRKLEQDCCWVHIPKAENCKARSEHASVREVGTHQKAVKGHVAGLLSHFLKSKTMHQNKRIPYSYYEGNLPAATQSDYLMIPTLSWILE